MDVPAGFPIRKAETILDYDFVEIGANKYLVPLKAKVLMHTTDNIKTKNEEEFTLYRKFGTESNIVFAPQPIDDSKTTEQPPDSSQQPAKGGNAQQHQPANDTNSTGLPPPPAPPPPQ